MFLSSAAVTWFATHLTPCIINFASQLTRRVIIFASHFGLCMLITVSNGPRGRLQQVPASPRTHPALPGIGAEPEADRTSLGWEHSMARTAAGTRCRMPLLFPDPSSPAPPRLIALISYRLCPPLSAALISFPVCFAALWLRSLALRSPNDLQGIHKFFVQLQLGGCFCRMPWKKYLS